MLESNAWFSHGDESNAHDVIRAVPHSKTGKEPTKPLIDADLKHHIKACMHYSATAIRNTRLRRLLFTSYFEWQGNKICVSAENEQLPS